jgi:hypothetical protein
VRSTSGSPPTLETDPASSIWASRTVWPGPSVEPGTAIVDRASERLWPSPAPAPAKDGWAARATWPGSRAPGVTDPALVRWASVELWPGPSSSERVAPGVGTDPAPRCRAPVVLRPGPSEGEAGRTAAPERLPCCLRPSCDMFTLTLRADGSSPTSLSEDPSSVSGGPKTAPALERRSPSHLWPGSVTSRSTTACESRLGLGTGMGAAVLWRSPIQRPPSPTAPQALHPVASPMSGGPDGNATAGVASSMAVTVGLSTAPALRTRLPYLLRPAPWRLFEPGDITTLGDRSEWVPGQVLSAGIKLSDREHASAGWACAGTRRSGGRTGDSARERSDAGIVASGDTSTSACVIVVPPRRRVG